MFMPLSRRLDEALSVALLFLSLMVPALAQSITETNQQADKKKAQPSSNPFHNDRIKRAELNDYPIETVHGTLAIVDGMWVPESKDPAKDMVFPEQVKINCTNSEKTCEELKVILEPMSGVVFIDIDQTFWQITSWDAHGLLASYGPDVSASAASDRCNRHVLTMTFASGAVSTSDIPTHDKGCEAFTETNSYRLARGGYYVDTSPGNDEDSRIRTSRQSDKERGAVPAVH
jgi:hypothetical protein